jgi:hypothetical protein
MSQVAISGNASGTGVFTIASPNSNSNYTATLAAGTGTVVLDTLAQTLTNKTLTSPTITGAVMSSMASSIITSGTSVATTSGTAITFTSIPSWVKRITVMLNVVQGSATSPFMIRIGSGSITSTGYAGYTYTASANFTSATTGAQLQTGVSSTQPTNTVMTIVNISGNTWLFNGASAITSGGANISSFCIYSLALSGVLDRVQLTTANGTDTFTAGSINILYE